MTKSDYILMDKIPQRDNTLTKTVIMQILCVEFAQEQAMALYYYLFFRQKETEIILI